MREFLFRCRCGASVRSGLVDPTPRHPRAVRRTPVLSVERRCDACGHVAEYRLGYASDALATHA